MKLTIEEEHVARSFRVILEYSFERGVVEVERGGGKKGGRCFCGGECVFQSVVVRVMMIVVVAMDAVSNDGAYDGPHVVTGEHGEEGAAGSNRD